MSVVDGTINDDRNKLSSLLSGESPQIERKERDAFAMVTHVGLLDTMLTMQARDDATVAYPAVRTHAAQVVSYANSLADHVVLLPVGNHASRLLGVVDVVSAGGLDIPGWNRDLTGRTVLLAGTVTHTLVEFQMAAIAARRQGAIAVHGCAVEVTHVDECEGLDSFLVLPPVSQTWQRSA
jgi:hypothetical protein